MRSTWLILAAVAALAACSGPAPVAKGPVPARAAVSATAAREVERITGTVTVASAARFADLVSAQEGQVIGLKVQVTPGTDADFKASRYLAEADRGQFVVSIGDGGGEGDGTEVVLPEAEASRRHDAYVIDGFYKVKYGGMHQGISSFGLARVDPRAAPLNAAIVIKDRPLA